nr:hypothetical protein [Tanacetum cinerariifolium]
MTSFDYRLNPLYLIKECSSCGSLYTTDYCCSKGILGDKIICDLDQTPDLSQRPPQNCPRCGNPVDGHYCQGCALLRNKFKEDLFTYCIENEVLQNSFEPSNDNTNVVNALREPFVVKQDPGKNSSQSPPQINHHCCYGCGDPLEYIFCHQCTCELCGRGAHYGYNCPSKVPVVPDPEPFNNQIVSSHQLCQVLIQHATLKMGIHSLMIPHLILFMILLTFLTHLRNLPFILVNFAGTMLKKEEKQIKEEKAANARYWKIPACYDDDDDDYTIAITHKEPDNSLRMGDEHLDTIPVTESDEFIKSSVENLVPNPSESEGEYECDVPACEVFTTFLNILFDADYDFYSSNDQSFSDEDTPKKINSNPLFDEEIISMKIDPHHFNTESNRINETDCNPEEETHFIKRLLYDNSSPRPPEEFISKNSDAAIESFSIVTLL